MAHVIRRLAATLLAVLALPLAGAPPIPRVQRAAQVVALQLVKRHIVPAARGGQHGGL